MRRQNFGENFYPKDFVTRTWSGHGRPSRSECPNGCAPVPVPAPPDLLATATAPYAATLVGARTLTWDEVVSLPDAADALRAVYLDLVEAEDEDLVR